MDGVQGGSSGGDIFGQIMNVVEMVINPVKLIEGIVKAIGGATGGDSVSQSQAQSGTAGTATTELPDADQWPGYVQGKEKKDDAEMARTLEVIEQNWDLFDTGNGKFGKDGKVTLMELTQIADDPSLPKEVRDAARKVAQSPWLMNKLDGGAAGSARDGAFTLADLKWLLGSVEQTAKLNGAAQTSAAQSAPQVQGRSDVSAQQGGELPEALGSTPAQQSGLTAGISPAVAQSQSAMTSVLDDPSVSFEGKTNFVCDQMMQGSEEQAVDAYRDYEGALAAAQNAKTDAEMQKASAEVTHLNMRVQQALQRRQEMFQLLSNINTMSHDMAMAAIRNMKD